MPCQTWKYNVCPDHPFLDTKWKKEHHRDTKRGIWKNFEKKNHKMFNSVVRNVIHKKRVGFFYKYHW